jgi:hypothetical protein
VSFRPIPNISLFAIKENIFNYFTFPSLPSHLGESHVFERLSQQGQKKNQNNIIMAGVGMAGNLYFTDVLAGAILRAKC